MTRRALLLALLALVLLALAFVMGQARRGPELTAAAGEQAAVSGYGYVATDVNVQQTDAAGRPQYELGAQQVEQRTVGGPIAASGLTLYYDPRDAQGQALTGRRWTLRADSAQLPQAGGLLELRGNVVANARPGDSAAPVTVLTDSLDYDTLSQQLRTDALVQFQWDRRQLQGRGLNANIRLGTFELNADVHGRSAR